VCFLGSKRYPVENEYKAYLSKHGGTSNASTSLSMTTYKFEVLAAHAEQALDIFSQFFVAPLFSLSGTDREVNAVDSENSKNLTADVRRRLQILKDLCDPEHAFSKFTTGNATTLPTSTPAELERTREALLAFHRFHYRPEKLTVTVAGPQSLDELQDWVVPRFGDMVGCDIKPYDDMSEMERMIYEAAKDVSPIAFDDPPLPFYSPLRPELQKGLYPATTPSGAPFASSSPTYWPVLLTVKPVRSMRRLVLMFPVPSVHKIPDTSPVSVLSHLLGHEGPASPFAVLQNHGLISSLSAGARASAPNFTIFQVDMSLTVQGEERWKDVVDVILQYCRFIHSKTVAAIKEQEGGSSSSSTATTSSPTLEKLQGIWDENATLSKIFFDQTSPGSVYGLCPDLCNSIVTQGTERCLSAGSMLQESKETFPLQAVEDFASRLVASNCLIERCSQTAWDEMEQQEQLIKSNSDNDDSGNGGSGVVIRRKTEPWYSIDYFLSTIDKPDVDRWQGQAGTQPFLDASPWQDLPRPNRYIPRTLELCPDLPLEARNGPRIDKEIDPPNLLIHDDTGRLWHRLDDRYALPKSELIFFIANAACENVKQHDGIWTFDASTSIRSSLLTSIFNQALAQETYDADLAGLHWSLSVSSNGIRIGCSGFSDRLSDLALYILQRFLAHDFFEESYFLSSKDRTLRSLKTYFESRRADSHATYYRDLLLASNNNGLDESIQAAEVATLESVKTHHTTLMDNDEIFVDCLYSGNVSETQARVFFQQATDLLQKATPIRHALETNKKAMWVPGHSEVRLSPGENIELHFASRNDQEENGGVLVTYQSLIPGFRGVDLSPPESLSSSASLRLLSHILREPLYTELRTRQTLGYVVSSYYDLGFSQRPAELYHLGPISVPVDFIVISILSRKVSPPEVVKRIDEFLADFRRVLMEMPESEIQHHATALSTKMLKPIQKLREEAHNHFGKIRNYAPEVFASQKTAAAAAAAMNGATGPVATTSTDTPIDVDAADASLKDLPWNSVKTLARAIESCSRQDLLTIWDRMMLPEHGAARVVSCVYGTTFPLPKEHIAAASIARSNSKVIVNSIPQVVALRKTCPAYDNTIIAASKNRRFFSSVTASAFLVKARQYSTSSTSGSRLVSAAALVSFVGVGAVGWMLLNKGKKTSTL
jgi:insulysin